MKVDRRGFIKYGIGLALAAALATVLRSRLFRALEPKLPPKAVENLKNRLPPKQYETKVLPVLHAGKVPKIDISNWRLKVNGLVGNAMEYTFDDIRNLPSTKVKVDIHCVTKWSKLDSVWEGISFKELVKIVKPKETVTHVVFETEQDWTTSLPLKELIRENVILSYKYEGKELTPEHGWPLRLVVPHKYFYKSAKWVNGILFIDHDELGFWEKRGYSNTADPWSNDRYS